MARGLHDGPLHQLEVTEQMSQTNVNAPGNGSSGTGAGMIVGFLLAVIVIGFVIWYFLLKGGGTGTPSASSLQSTLQSVVQSVVQSVLQSVAPSPS